jgi:fatty-acyl-CoA synthase
LKRIHQRKLALEEYLVGGSALPKSLIEGFEKILEYEVFRLGNDRNLSSRNSKQATATAHDHLSKMKNGYS